MAAPLADRIRPDSLDDVVGQAHLLGPGAVCGGWWIRGISPI